MPARGGRQRQVATTKPVGSRADEALSNPDWQPLH